MKKKKLQQPMAGGVMSFYDLIQKWEHEARRSFWDAEKEKYLMGKRALENRGIIYVNCIRELKEVLKSFSPELLTKQEGYQK